MWVILGVWTTRSISSSMLSRPVSSNKRTPSPKITGVRWISSFVEQSHLEELRHGVAATSNVDVPILGGRPCLIEGALDAIGNEGERGAAFLDERVSRVVGEHEHGRAEGRFISPGLFAFVEHASTEHNCSGGSEAFAKHVVVLVGPAPLWP